MPVALPVGLWVVGPGKRATAALLDMIPAAVIVLALWFYPISGFFREFLAAARSGETQAMDALQWPESLTWAWMWFRLVYVAYCIGFEILVLILDLPTTLFLGLAQLDACDITGLQVVGIIILYTYLGGYLHGCQLGFGAQSQIVQQWGNQIKRLRCAKPG